MPTGGRFGGGEGWRRDEQGHADEPGQQASVGERRGAARASGSGSVDHRVSLSCRAKSVRISYGQYIRTYNRRN